MFIKHNQADFFTVSFGNSPRTLLALGGWIGSWELWTTPFMELSHTWRTIAYDHRGTGATLAPVESITLENMVGDVFAILDALEVETCVLAAESAGTAIALLAALEQPQRFSGLVLVDGLYYRPQPASEEPFVTGLKQHYLATLAQFVETCVPEPDSEAIKRWGRQILERAPQAAAIRLYECVYGLDLRPRLAELTLPTLIIHGELDRIVPLSAAEWLHSQLPHSHLHVVVGAGHVPTMTRPKEIAEAINRFFAE